MEKNYLVDKTLSLLGVHAELQGCFYHRKNLDAIMDVLKDSDVNELYIRNIASDFWSEPSLMSVEDTSRFFMCIRSGLIANQSITSLNICVDQTCARSALDLFKDAMSVLHSLTEVIFDIPYSVNHEFEPFVLEFVQMAASNAKIRKVSVSHPMLYPTFREIRSAVTRNTTICELHFITGNPFVDYNDDRFQAIKYEISVHVSNNNWMLNERVPCMFDDKNAKYLVGYFGSIYGPAAQAAFRHVVFHHVRMPTDQLFFVIRRFTGARVLKLIDCDITSEDDDNKKK